MTPVDVFRLHTWWPVNGHYVCKCGWSGDDPRQHVVNAILGSYGLHTDCKPRRHWRVCKRDGEWRVYQRGTWAEAYPTLVEAHTSATQNAVADMVFAPGGLTRCRELLEAAR